MTQEKRNEAIKWLKEEIRSLRLAPEINGCGPENWADQLEIMEICLEAVKADELKPLTMEQLREMDGQPAWCEEQKEWGIIHIDPDGMWANIPFFRGIYCDLDVQHQGLTLYARPQANIDWEAWTAEWEEDGKCDHKPYRVRDAEKWKKYKCSKCGYKAGRRTSQKYCPSCGRAMTPGARDELKKRIREGELYGEMPVLWL